MELTKDQRNMVVTVIASSLKDIYDCKKSYFYKEYKPGPLSDADITFFRKFLKALEWKIGTEDSTHQIWWRWLIAPYNIVPDGTDDEIIGFAIQVMKRPAPDKRRVLEASCIALSFTA